MSSIQANSAAVHGLLTIPRNVPVLQAGPRRFTQSTDLALMHAWSIGTTRVAQNPAPDRASQSEKSAGEKPASHPDDCPPEVYIG